MIVAPIARSRLPLLLVGIVFGVAAADAAGEGDKKAQPPDDANSTRSLGVMYHGSSQEVWGRVREMLAELSLPTEDLDATNGVAITRWSSFRRRAFREVQTPPVWEGYTAERFRLHVFVPQSIEPARVYVGSIVEARNRLRRFTAQFYNVRSVERWFLDRLAERLGETGYVVPGDREQRRLLALHLRPDLGDDPCVNPKPPGSEPHEAEWGPGDVAPPALIASTKVRPIYPELLRRKGIEGRLVFHIVVREDGAVESPVPIQPARPDEQLLIAAREAVGFWRYRPARSAGCPVDVYFTVRVDFNIDR